jgi:nucleotide-binding universal stress UspA family protein
MPRSSDNVHNPAKAILDSAKAFDATHIVMGTRGLSDIEGLLLGSVTHKVIQKSDVPVTVVP